MRVVTRLAGARPFDGRVGRHDASTLIASQTISKAQSDMADAAIEANRHMTSATPNVLTFRYAAQMMYPTGNTTEARNDRNAMTDARTLPSTPPSFLRK